LKGNLRLDTAEGVLQGGDNGPVIVPGNPNESLLIRALKHEGPKMPPTRRLPNNVINNFIRWIEMGAPDPRSSNIAGSPEGGVPGGIGGSFAGVEAAEPTLRDQAIDAFRGGNEKEAFRLLHTYFAFSPDGANELREKMAWMPGLRRPALGPRIGIAAIYVNASTLPRDFDESPQPIGSSELTTAMADFGKAAEERRNASGGEEPRRRGRPAPEASAESPMPELGTDGGRQSGAAGQLEYYTGEFGTKLLDRLKQKIESGEYGAIYKDLAGEAAPRRSGDPNNPDPNLSSAGGEGSGSTGQFGSQDGGQPGGRENGRGGANGAGGEEAANQLALGVVWLGKFNTRDELNKALQSDNIDLLVVYDLTLQPGKNTSFVNNKTKIRITPAKSNRREEMLFNSTLLENRLVMQAREKGIKGDDPVDKEVKGAIEALDKSCKPEPLPAALTAEVAKRRVAALIAEKPADPLSVLVEVRLYVAKGLLSESDFEAAAVSLLGEAEYGKLLASAQGAEMGQWSGLSAVLEVLHGLNDASSAMPAASGPAATPGAKGGKAGGPRGKAPQGQP
jgi:hypothetical protein